MDGLYSLVNIDDDPCVDLQIMTYCQLGRVEEAVRLLRTVLSNDRPDYFQQGGEIFEEVVRPLAPVPYSRYSDYEWEFWISRK